MILVAAATAPARRSIVHPASRRGSIRGSGDRRPPRSLEQWAADYPVGS
jgi:hypothetical protein